MTTNNEGSQASQEDAPTQSDVSLDKIRDSQQGTQMLGAPAQVATASDSQQTTQLPEDLQAKSFLQKIVSRLLHPSIEYCTVFVV